MSQLPPLTPDVRKNLRDAIHDGTFPKDYAAQCSDHGFVLRMLNDLDAADVALAAREKENLSLRRLVAPLTETVGILNQTVEKLKAESTAAAERERVLREALAHHVGKRAPVQGFSAGLPWDMHLQAYDAYCKKCGPQQSLIEDNCRGGFGVKELNLFIPGWRDELTRRADVDRAAEQDWAGIVEQKKRLRTENAKMEKCLGFFASVIKSGEPWTEVCEREYNAALSRELVGGRPT